MRFLLLFLPLFVLSCGGDKSKVEDTGTITVEDADARADEIAAIYESAASYVNASMPHLLEANQMKLTVNNVVAVDNADLSKHNWSDIIDYYSGWTIQIHRGTTSYPDGSPTTVEYLAEWFEVDPEFDPYKTTDGAAVPEISVPDALAMYRKMGGALSPVDVLSLYDVGLSFQGKERTYKALAVWSKGSATNRSTLTVFDIVVDRINDIAQETLSTATESPSRFAAPPPPPADVCIETETTVPGSTMTEYDDEGHLSGEHGINVGASATCQCNLKCESNCTINWSVKDCPQDSPYAIEPISIADSPVLFAAYHKVLRDSDQRGITGSYPTEGTCAGAHLCSYKECSVIFGCGGSVNVEVKKDLSFKIDNDPDAFWSPSYERTFECGKCELEPPPTDYGTYEGIVSFTVDYQDYDTMNNPNTLTHGCEVELGGEADANGEITGDASCATTDIEMIKDVAVRFVGKNTIEFNVTGVSGEIQQEAIDWAVPATTETSSADNFSIMLSLNIPYGDYSGGAVAIEGSYNIEKISPGTP